MHSVQLKTVAAFIAAVPNWHTKGSIEARNVEYCSKDSKRNVRPILDSKSEKHQIRKWWKWMIKLWVWKRTSRNASHMWKEEIKLPSKNQEGWRKQDKVQGLNAIEETRSKRDHNMRKQKQTWGARIEVLLTNIDL